MSSAKRELERIELETARRKELWTRLQREAVVAVQGVTRVARRHGIKNQDWLGGSSAPFGKDCCQIVLDSHAKRQATTAAALARIPDEDLEHYIFVFGTGKIAGARRPELELYNGCPNLHPDDVACFGALIARELTIALNSYAESQRQKGKD